MDSVDETLATSASSLELEHYGVKGMKWGVRKQKTPSSSGRLVATKKTSKPLSELSNKDLREAIERARLENEYLKVTQPKKSRTRGQAFRDRALQEVGNIAMQAVREVAKEQVRRQLNSAINNARSSK